MFGLATMEDKLEAAVIAHVLPLGHSAEAATVTQYWIDNWAENGYCRPCAEKKLAEIRAATPDDDDIGLSGGWRTEEDGQRFCDTCGVQLDVSFTDYAVESELEHFELHGLDIASPGDVSIVPK